MYILRNIKIIFCIITIFSNKNNVHSMDFLANYLTSQNKKNIEIIENIITNIKEQEQQKDIGMWKFLKRNFNLLSLISDYEAESFVWNNFYEKDNLSTRIPFWQYFWESTFIEIVLNTFFKVLKMIFKALGVSLDEASIYKKYAKHNYKVRSFPLSKKEKKAFSYMACLLKMSRKSNNKPVMYISGPPGVGKTLNVINELVKNGYTIYYINASNILYGDYDNFNVTNTLENLWNKIAQDQSGKSILVCDECIELMLKTEKRTDINPKDINAIIANNRRQLSATIKNFFLSRLSQNNTPIVFITNDTTYNHPQVDENKEDIPQIAPEMSRRINFMFEMELPSIENLVSLWIHYLRRYKIYITDAPISEVIIILSVWCVKNKISIRDISQFACLFQERELCLQEVFNILKKS